MDDPSAILLINRDRDFLEATCRSVRGSGYSVLTAMDMRGALSAIAGQGVGLIICDNTLADVSGYDFLHYLKCDPLRDSIPFVFLVPVNDQGRAFKAFQLGATDFLVYPLEEAALIARIREILPRTPDVSGEPTVPPAVDAGGDVAGTEPGQVAVERRKSKRIHPLPPLRIEVSRDGILWMPCRLRNFSPTGMFLETSLLGKPGSKLAIRLHMPQGPQVIEAHIKHVSFENELQSAGIGVEVDDLGEWAGVFEYLNSVMDIAKSHVPTDEGASESGQGPSARMKALLAQASSIEKTATQLLGQDRPKEPSLNTRFYHSMVGKQLDSYKAMSFIGSGNMGGVFKAWDVSLERLVALKIISHDLSNKEKFRDMFIKEARFVSKLDHPNIAHIYNIGNTNDILYYAMEYINGETLLDLIKKGQNLNTLRGLELLIKICETLDFVTKQNIIHRDIKPANIMINDKGILKIVDFGVAKLVDVNAKEASQEGIVGSPLYMSPDCIEGRPLDQRSDIYSLGATFYHVLTGSPPYTGDNAEEVLLKHMKGELTPPKVKNPKVPTPLSRIIERMMARDPEDRYQQYQDIVTNLEALRSRALRIQRMKNATLVFRVKDNEIVEV